MLRIRLEKRIQAPPVKPAAKDIQAVETRVTRHESFSHSVINRGANRFKKAALGLLHGRTPRNPTQKPSEHRNAPQLGFLDIGAHIRRMIPRTDV